LDNRLDGPQSWTGRGGGDIGKITTYANNGKLVKAELG